MQVLAGTSGFSYKEWLGAFYPPKLAASEMLAHYASKLPAVEINNTFYRMPNEAAIRSWRSQVPDTFRFAIKVPRRLTHVKRLKDCGDDLERLMGAVRHLGGRLGSLLVQLPPHAKVDLVALEAFLRDLPRDVRAAFEFRNASWLVPPVYDLMRAANAALVQSESEDGFKPLPWTADWAYLRLRKPAYASAELRAWLERLAVAGVKEAQVFFKHEDGATGPKLASELLALAA